MTTGIYKIEAPSGGVYIGQSLNCERRGRNHCGLLRKGKHFNPALNRAWAKYGDALTFSIVDECSPWNLDKLEQMHINALGPKAYNMQKVKTQGVESLELRAKRSINTKLALARPEVKANVAKSFELRYSVPGWADTWKASNARRIERLHAERLRDAGILLLSDLALNTLYNRYKNKRVVQDTTFNQVQTQVAWTVTRSRKNHGK